MVIFYESETILSLLLASLPALVSLYLFFIRGERRIAITCLLLSALLIRLLMISLDPFLHEWDERFHAVVAKSMITHPFRPTLFAHHVIPYDPADWSYCLVWLHKPPLFLWQMALSMKLLGVNLIALRLPSAILGVFMVWWIYDIGKRWMKKEEIGFIAAFLSTFSWFTLELTSGRLSLDHNDLAFVAYMTGANWAWVRYIEHKTWRWAMLIGVFAGMAILTKWLTGLLVFGGWGLYLLMSSPLERKGWLHFVTALAVTCLIFLPWYIYIGQVFPIETAAAFAGYDRHFKEALGHPGTNWYHLDFLSTAYSKWMVVLLLPVGVVTALIAKWINRKLSIAFIAMIIVIFGFFSLFVQSRMPAFVFPVSGLLYVMMGLGLVTIVALTNRLRNGLVMQNWILMLLTALFGFLHLKPHDIIHHRAITNDVRNEKIETAKLMRNVQDEYVQDRLVFNTRSYDNIDLMFYKNTIAYHYYFTEKQLDSLQAQGYKFTAFNYDIPALPDYVLQDPEIIILPVK